MRLSSLIPLALLASACATPAVEKMSFSEAFSKSSNAFAEQQGARPAKPAEPAKAPAVEATSSVELQSALIAFTTRARRHRGEVTRGSPMPFNEISNWVDLHGVVDGMLARPAREISSFDLIRARVTMEAELELDARAFGDIPEELTNDIMDRVARIVLRMAQVRRLKVQTREVKPEFGWPVTPVAVTSLFGRRLHPIAKVYRQHMGIDLAAEQGQFVHAAAKGTVTRAEWAGSHGFHVEISHPNGVLTGYSHLSQLLVEAGAVVERGDPVGLAGNTGLSTGVHVHFEVWRQGKACDPLEELAQPPAVVAPLATLRQTSGAALGAAATGSP